MRRLVPFLTLVLTLMAASPAAARSSEEYAYGYDQLWRTAVRLVAVDFRFPILERDPDIGYLLFTYREGARTCDGSVELVRTQARDGSEHVTVVVTIAAMPTYVERMVLDRLRRKLTDEHGTPRPARPAPPPPPATDDDDEDPPAEEPPAS